MQIINMRAQKTSIEQTDASRLFIVQQETGYSETMNDQFIKAAWETAAKNFHQPDLSSNFNVDFMAFNDLLNSFLAR